MFRRSTSTWTKMLKSSSTSTTWIDYCGERTLMSLKSPCLLCKWITTFTPLHPCRKTCHDDLSLQDAGYVSKELSQDTIYLSPMHITERNITGYNIPDTAEALVNLAPKERVVPERTDRRNQASGGNVHLWSHEEDQGKWVCPGCPPLWVSRKHVWNMYIATS